MNSKKVYFGMLGFVSILALTIIGSTFYGNTLLQNKSAELLEQKVNNLTLDEQQIALIRAKKDIAQYESEERIAKAIVPQEKDQAKTVREIINIADASGIGIASISFPSSTLGAPKVKTSAGTSTPANTTPSETQVKPVEGITGVYQLEITIQSDPNKPVRYEQLIDFLKRLEQNRRTAHVTNINVQPYAEDRNFVTFSLVVNVYIKP